MRYKALVESFLRVFLHSHPKKCGDGPADQAMAQFMNRLYLRGHKSQVGDKLIAAWAVIFPAFSKQERSLLSRVAQTLRGWHRQGPAPSRSPVPLIVMSRIVVEKIRTGKQARRRQLKSATKYEKTGRAAQEAMKLSTAMIQ